MSHIFRLHQQQKGSGRILKWQANPYFMEAGRTKKKVWQIKTFPCCSPLLFVPDVDRTFCARKETNWIYNITDYHYVELKILNWETIDLKEAEPLVWMVRIFILSFIPIMAIWKTWQSRNSSKSLFRPTAQWVPADEVVTTVGF